MRQAALLAAWLMGLVAQPAPPREVPAQDGAAAPVSLTLRTAGGRHQFRPGEIIPIELEFSSHVAGRYVVDGATYDRSGRLAIDEFRIDPFKGVTDPMLDYYGAQSGTIGGGIRTMGTLGDEPFIVKLELNAWFRFHRPGTYQISVRSSRVTDELSGTATSRALVPVESNPMMIEILPADRAWEAATVAEALQILDGSDGDVERRRGCRLLRFLANEAAVDQMIRRFDDGQWGCDFEYSAGLFAAPNRAYVVQQLEERLVAPDQPVSARYLRTLAVLSIYLRHPELRPDQTRETAGRIVSGELGRRREMVAAAIEDCTAVLMPALPAKGPRARAFSLAELLNMRLGTGTAGHALKIQVAGAFLDLPVGRQQALLEYQWSQHGGPAMLPALRRIAAAPRESASPVFDLALRRLHELAPEEARPLILREIGDPRPGVSIATLGSLPDHELPELEEDLVAGLERDGHDGLRALLLERYGSAAPAPRVLAMVDDRIPGMACRPQAALLAYLLRADPTAGVRLLERVLAARAGTGCYQIVLGDVADLHMTAAIERLAIEHLDDPDPGVVRGAAGALGRHGSPAALPPLRARFERWSQAWKGREEELRFTHAAKAPHPAEATVEDALRQALGLAQGWVMDAAALRELHAWCVTAGCRQQVDFMIDAAERWTIRVGRLGEPIADIWIAQYQPRSLAALEQKLGQYPRGSAFKLDVAGLDAESASLVTARVQAVAAERGLTVTK
jgi:hypothetical protein